MKNFLLFLSERQKERATAAIGAKKSEAPAVGGGGLAGLNFDDDSDMQSIEEVEETLKAVQTVNINANSSPMDLIMCCCRKHLPHDETIKFKINCKEENRRRNVLDKPLFLNRDDGYLEQSGSEVVDQRMTIPTFIDKRLLYGRHLLLHEIIQFLTVLNS